jgi:putative photosynthetic complex assembly protein 2
MDHLLPALFVVLVWWSGTALVFLLDQAPRAAALGAATAAMLVALVGAWVLSGTATPAAAYGGFLCGVAAWAWQEAFFLGGVLTGPNRAPLPSGTRGVARFRLSAAAVMHHEVAILLMGAALLALVWGAANQVALHTFLVLWVMRLSAKLNLFLGCRNLGEGMLPPRLAHLSSHFRRRRMNALFPVSIGGGALAAWWMLEAAIGGTPFAVVAWTLLATLMLLAVIEHAFLMLPVSLDGLWSWGRPQPARADAAPLRP